jgi:formamidopyrimidine-DNA glycosylase
MPELPEVAGFQTYLNSTALHKRIAGTTIEDNRILRGITPQQLGKRLKGAQFESTARHGKFLFLELDHGGWMVLHFAATGDVRYYKNSHEPSPNTRFLVGFDNHYRLAYRSKRALGQISFTEEPATFIRERALGPDALDDKLEADAFIETLTGRRGAIKPALMNQSIVAGVGSVYADEILFQAGIHPDTAINQLDPERLRELHRTMRRVLRLAVDRGGQVEKLPRGYLLPERREGGRCPRCGAGLQRSETAGHTSYFCSHCQEPG